MSSSVGSLPLKLALAQIKTYPGQIEANRKKIEDNILKAAEAEVDLIVFPELALPGYACHDLFLDQSYLEANLNALEQIVKCTSGITAVVGFAEFDRLHQRAGKRPVVYNSAAFISNGKLQSVHRKCLLPNYSIFEEERYFVAGDKPSIVEMQGIKVGLLICEDLWSEHYPINPAQLLKQQGAEVLVNLSASPFEFGKYKQRLGVIQNTAKVFAVPLVYCNLVGCYDGYEGEVVFDGRSLLADSNGTIIAEAQAFSEDFLLCDLNTEKKQTVSSSLNDCEELHRALVLGIKDYFERLAILAKLPQAAALVGVSGGIDSAVVLALAVAALGPSRVIAVNMPSEFNSSEGISDSKKLCKNLHVEYHEFSIREGLKLFQGTLSSLPFNGGTELANENLQARLRMLVLMYFANKLNAVVLNTGNKTELALDNCTIYGDMLGGLAVLADVDKDRVYDLADYINQQTSIGVIPQSIIDRIPTAELKANQVDADVMGAEPRLLGPIMRAIVEEGLTYSEVLVRFGALVEAELIFKLFDRLERAEWKRRQAAPGIRVTGKAFGLGRRIPILHGFRS